MCELQALSREELISAYRKRSAQACGMKARRAETQALPGSVHDSRYPQGHAVTENSGSSELRIPCIHSLAHSRVPLEIIEL